MLLAINYAQNYASIIGKGLEAVHCVSVSVYVSTLDLPGDEVQTDRARLFFSIFGLGAIRRQLVMNKAGLFCLVEGRNAHAFFPPPCHTHFIKTCML